MAWERVRTHLQETFCLCPRVGLLNLEGDAQSDLCPRWKDRPFMPTRPSTTLLEAELPERIRLAPL
jgi:hypothetical protein